MKLGFPLFPKTASTMAGQIDAIYFFGLAISAIFSVLIAGLIFYLAVRYRRTSSNRVGQREKSPLWLEITWSVIPFGIMLVMFGWGAKVFFDTQRVPTNAVEYYATGKQWMWKFQHPEGNREINNLHVPVGQTIKLTMTSEDVIHSVYVPAFRIKKDVVPGRYTTLWFEATKPGRYNLFCAEYCGAEHSQMIGSVIVMEPRDYEEWLAHGEQGQTVQLAGEELFTAKACNTCHQENSSARAPILHGVFGTERPLLDGDTVVADETYLRESILDPREQVVAGYNPIMPTYQGQLSEQELLELVSYIKTLDAPASGGASGAAP